MEDSKPNKSLTFKTHPDNISVDFTNKNFVSVNIHGDMGVSIEFDNDVLLKSNGDFMVVSKGEIDFITNGKPICFESINSEIHLNSRKAAPIKDHIESMEYRKQLEENNKQCSQIATMQEMQNKTLKERVSVLEKQIKSLLE